MVTISALEGSVVANGGAGADPRLRPAAHEFEACLMKEFLEPLERDPLFQDGKDGTSGDGSGNALMGFGAQALARAISERGGFGIAAKIIHQLQGKAQADGGAPESNESAKTNEKRGSR